MNTPRINQRATIANASAATQPRMIEGPQSLPAKWLSASASKAALIVMTKSLARTLGPAIRVNAVAPGVIDGEWLQQGLGDNYEKEKQAKAAANILGTVSTPEDIAGGILAMITAPKTTGHTLVIDAGDTLGPRIEGGIK